jgi:hypothetical protein|tara:strand:+ start:232 stop:579 length:348 start_codon:yes stop_codon:yes gene_type:complete
MAEKIPAKGDIIHAESLALGSSAENLVDAGATIPQNCGDIVVVCPSGDSLHWEPSVTPTSTLGRPITLGHSGRIPHAFTKTAKLISDDASDVTCILIYVRGSSRQDLAYTVSEPF